MNSKPALGSAFGEIYALTTETAEGRPVVRARLTHPVTGLKIVLTFQAQTDRDLVRFKERLVQIALHRRDKRQGTA